MEEQPDFERTRRRARLRADIERSKASRELNTYANDRQDDLGFVRHSQRWERSWANWLVREWGFDAEYVARRHGLALRTGDR